MSLTYQPFAESSTLEALQNELQHPLDQNVPEPERIASGLLGAALAVAGAGRSGLSRWALLLVGAALVGRAVTGRCPLYR